MYNDTKNIFNQDSKVYPTAEEYLKNDFNVMLVRSTKTKTGNRYNIFISTKDGSSTTNSLKIRVKNVNTKYDIFNTKANPNKTFKTKKPILTFQASANNLYFKAYVELFIKIWCKIYTMTLFPKDRKNSHLHTEFCGSLMRKVLRIFNRDNNTAKTKLMPEDATPEFIKKCVLDVECMETFTKQSPSVFTPFYNTYGPSLIYTLNAAKLEGKKNDNFHTMGKIAVPVIYPPTGELSSDPEVRLKVNHPGSFNALTIINYNSYLDFYKADLRYKKSLARDDKPNKIHKLKRKRDLAMKKHSHDMYANRTLKSSRLNTIIPRGALLNHLDFNIRSVYFGGSCISIQSDVRELVYSPISAKGAIIIDGINDSIEIDDDDSESSEEEPVDEEEHSQIK